MVNITVNTQVCPNTPADREEQLHLFSTQLTDLEKANPFIYWRLLPYLDSAGDYFEYRARVLIADIEQPNLAPVIGIRLKAMIKTLLEVLDTLNQQFLAVRRGQRIQG